MIDLLGRCFRLFLHRREFPASGLQYLVLLAVTINLQSAKEMDEVPRVVGLNVVGEGWHRRAVQTGHEDAVEIGVRGTALEARIILPATEVVRPDGLILAVSKRGRGGPVALALRTVTLPAFQLSEQGLPVSDALDGDRGFGGNLDGLAGLFLVPPRRERLDKRHQVSSLLLGERIPNRHIGVRQSATDGVV